jgi:L-lactate dehydrogenase
MQKVVGIIGTGWVGTSVAMAVLQTGAAQALWLHDARTAVAEGEAMDLSHGAAFYPRCAVQAVPLTEMRDADVVVVAAGRGGKPGESRLDLLRDNARLVADIGSLLSGFAGTVVLVTNPVDVLTQVMTEASGLPPERVLGTGTMLDTARLRQMLGQELHVATQSIHAQVIGEHGDSELVLWSGAQVGGVALRHWPNWSANTEQRLAREVRMAAYEVIQRKGATNHAIGLVTARLVECLLDDQHQVLTVSRMQQGACGLHGVALSLPALVSRSGATRVLEPTLDAVELAGLSHSAEVLRAARASFTL